MRINARIRALAVLVTVALTATACDGWSTRPTDMTSTGATLHAQTRCLADTTTNPCTYWFQYWADGSPTLVSTPHVVANVNTNGYIDVTQSVTGLSPNTL